MRGIAASRQDELDAFGREYGWTRGRFGSWRTKGWTISVGATGQPRKFIAAGRHEGREFKDLADLAEYVRGKRTGDRRG